MRFFAVGLRFLLFMLTVFGTVLVWPPSNAVAQYSHAGVKVIAGDKIDCSSLLSSPYVRRLQKGMTKKEMELFQKQGLQVLVEEAGKHGLSLSELLLDIVAVIELMLEISDSDSEIRVVSQASMQQVSLLSFIKTFENLLHINSKRIDRLSSTKKLNGKDREAMNLIIRAAVFLQSMGSEALGANTSREIYEFPITRNAAEGVIYFYKEAEDIVELFELQELDKSIKRLEMEDEKRTLSHGEAITAVSSGSIEAVKSTVDVIESVQEVASTDGDSTRFTGNLGSVAGTEEQLLANEIYSFRNADGLESSVRFHSKAIKSLSHLPERYTEKFMNSLLRHSATRSDKVKHLDSVGPGIIEVRATFRGHFRLIGCKKGNHIEVLELRNIPANAQSYSKLISSGLCKDYL